MESNPGNFYDELYARMQQMLAGLDGGEDAAAGMDRALAVLGGMILELRTAGQRAGTLVLQDEEQIRYARKWMVRPGDRYEWKETRTAAVEWIKSMAEAGSIHVNGKPATATQLKAIFEECFGVDMYDFDRLLYASDQRKLDATPLLNKWIQAFVGRRERLGK